FLGDVRSETDAREIFRLEERDADANRRTLFLRRRGGNKTNKKKSSPEDRADHCPITHFFLRHLGIDKARESTNKYMTLLGRHQFVTLDGRGESFTKVRLFRPQIHAISQDRSRRRYGKPYRRPECRQSSLPDCRSPAPCPPACQRRSIRSSRRGRG